MRATLAISGLSFLLAAAPNLMAQDSAGNTEAPVAQLAAPVPVRVHVPEISS